MSSIDDSIQDERAKNEKVRLLIQAVKSEAILGFNPFKIWTQLELWQKACAWHGIELPQKMAKAKINLPILIAHLEAFVNTLKRLQKASIKCKNCGKLYDLHNATTQHCPVGRKTRAGYIHYDASRKFKP